MKDEFVIGMVDVLGTKDTWNRSHEEAKRKILRFTQVCEKWAIEGSSSYPDDAQLFSDSLVVRWDSAPTPLVPLLELATLFVFIAYDNIDNPTEPLWVRGAIVQGNEKQIIFGRDPPKSNSKKRILRDYALTGFKVSMAEKCAPGNRLYMDYSLIKGKPELEKMGVEKLCVLPWPLKNTPLVDVFWCNAAWGEKNIFSLLPKWINICDVLFKKSTDPSKSKHARETLSMLLHAAFQRVHFRKDNYFSYPLRYIVWAACCDSSSISSKIFLDICKSLPSTLTKEFSDLFDANRIDLASDVVVNDQLIKEKFKFKLPWETRGIEP